MDICRFQTNGKGIHRIATSISTSEMDSAQKFPVWSMQCMSDAWGGRIRDRWTGVHWRSVLKKKAMPQVDASAMTAQETKLKREPRKMRR